MDTISGANKYLDGIPLTERFLGKPRDFRGLPSRGAWLVNESGFYKLVLKSRKPEARKFQDWVTGVVLPAIRKDGGYILGEEKVAASGRCMLSLAQCVSRLGRWTFSSELPRG